MYYIVLLLKCMVQNRKNTFPTSLMMVLFSETWDLITDLIFNMNSQLY